MKHVMIALSLSLSVLSAAAGPKATVVRQKPFNLFEPGQKIEFQVKGKPGEIAVADYDGNKVDFSFVDGKLSFGELKPGYYEIRHAGGMNSFAVAPFVHLSASDFLKEGRRFGLKVFVLGKPGVWWRRPLTWEVDECTTACERLGLQWTRHGFDVPPNPEEPGVISTLDLVTKHEMNCVMKVEGIPENAYDEKRYGPMEDFAKTKNKRGWRRCSVPLKEPYQAWLREQLKKLPPSQKVFEIGNEVWDYMTAEEFAEWCRMTVPVIKEVRPGALVGADPGSLAWGTHFAKAGGFEGMDVMYIHPYSFTPAPEVRIRAWLRNRREYFEKLVGRKFDVYVTEYGWPTAPKDKRGHSCDERRQAQRTARESLMLYAEDCKTLIPHWMADREQDPTEREHWFGCFRLCGEPKPVVVAHAACARMIDGSEFVGDLAIPGAETGVGAMLFRRKGGWVAAVWTRDEQPGAGREVVVPVKGAKAYGIMGAEAAIRETKNGVAFKASADMTYIVGKGDVPKSLAALVDKSGELSETRWNNRIDGDKPTRSVGREPSPVAMGWGPKNLGAEAAPRFSMWHDGALKIRLEVPEAALVNGEGRAFIYFSTRPERQPDIGDWKLYDYELKVGVKAGEFTVTLGNSTLGATLRPAQGGDPSGIAWSGELRDGAATFEIAIPEKFLNGFGTNKKGLMAGQVSWATNGRSWKLQSKNAEKSYEWPLWKLN